MALIAAATILVTLLVSPLAAHGSTVYSYRTESTFATCTYRVDAPDGSWSEIYFDVSDSHSVSRAPGVFIKDWVDFTPVARITRYQPATAEGPQRLEIGMYWAQSPVPFTIDRKLSRASVSFSGPMSWTEYVGDLPDEDNGIFPAPARQWEGPVVSFDAQWSATAKAVTTRTPGREVSEGYVSKWLGVTKERVAAVDLTTVASDGTMYADHAQATGVLGESSYRDMTVLSE
jgi:hypothetical protein